MRPSLMRITLATAVVALVLVAGFGRLMQTTFDNNGAVPWQHPGGIGWLLLIAAALAGGWAFAYVFLRGYEGGGWREGLRFGFWATLLTGVPASLGFAAILPVGRRLPVEFVIATFVTLVICGVVAAMLAGQAGRASGAAAG